MHYLDEGPRDGETLVMVHGNPSWSFYYRELVKAFRGTHRVLVPDHIGCGLSDKPSDDRYPYRLERRVDDLEAWLEHVDAGPKVTLVLHDWGGMIGMAWAARHPDRVARLVLFNTGAFHKPPGKHLPWQLWLARNTWVGTVLVRGLNAFARGAVKTCVTARPMPDRVAEAMCAPYDSWANRIATLRFVQDIPLAPADPGYDVITKTQDGIAAFLNTPTLMCWGDRDFVFDAHFLAEWRRRLPRAEVHQFPDAGHYVVEDATERIIPLMTTFLAAHPVNAAAGAAAL